MKMEKPPADPEAVAVSWSRYWVTPFVVPAATLLAVTPVLAELIALTMSSTELDAAVISTPAAVPIRIVIEWSLDASAVVSLIAAVTDTCV